ncbi:hypothetical protein WJX73_005901 [Symbiochloris irregularis]|uniref:peptidyl-tRNA hydrolase n=1 Tax=Symbiochloris irregularis TaxID=706552 RepID=A0AAW1PJD6_9CHLO
MSAAGDSAAQGEDDGPILQYVILRADLWHEQKWPLGSIVTQGAHAAVAAVWVSRDAEHTQQYCTGDALNHMHKVTLEVKGETQLRNLAEKLEEAGIQHKLWMEQPEDIPTCIATVPLPKAQVHPHVKRLKLCKGG